MQSAFLRVYPVFSGFRRVCLRQRTLHFSRNLGSPRLLLETSRGSATYMRDDRNKNSVPLETRAQNNTAPKEFPRPMSSSTGPSNGTACLHNAVAKAIDSPDPLGSTARRRTLRPERSLDKLAVRSASAYFIYPRGNRRAQKQVARKSSRDR